MKVSVEALWAMPEAELLAAYHEARRLHAEKKFARDTERGRLTWVRAKTFSQASGGVSDRTNAVDAAEDLARKGQHVRELTLEVDLIKSDVDVIAACLRLKGVLAPSSRLGEQAEGRDEDGASDAS